MSLVIERLLTGFVVVFGGLEPLDELVKEWSHLLLGLFVVEAGALVRAGLGGVPRNKVLVLHNALVVENHA